MPRARSSGQYLDDTSINKCACFGMSLQRVQAEVVLLIKSLSQTSAFDYGYEQKLVGLDTSDNSVITLETCVDFLASASSRPPRDPLGDSLNFPKSPGFV